jgi:hypothetical protein
VCIRLSGLKNADHTCKDRTEEKKLNLSGISVEEKLNFFLVVSVRVIFRFRQISNFIFALYGCETWSLTFREEHKLGGFENRVLRRIFGPKRDEDGSWRKLYNLYSSPNIVRVIKSRRMR